VRGYRENSHWQRKILSQPSAVDTNVLVRLLTQNDHKQSAAARSLFASGPIWIAKTVLLETGRVLNLLFGAPGERECPKSAAINAIWVSRPPGYRVCAYPIPYPKNLVS
jgi:hypothetical protein